MKLSADPRLPGHMDSELRARLYELWRSFALSINTGSMWDDEGTAIPTSGSFSVGYKRKNSAPSELGSGGSKYLIIGWCCVASGSPGTWTDMRVLTGN